ncbi:MAG: hypothetical protein ACLRFK_00695 [Alphaproteobacteria bacterium]
MPKSRNRKIKKKNKTKVYSNIRKYKEIEKVPGEGWVNALVFAMMLTMATGLMYSVKNKKDAEKVVPLSEIEAARQKVQNANTVIFMDTVRKHTR